MIYLDDVSTFQLKDEFEKEQHHLASFFVPF
jgi:hypothetical protein